MKDIRESFTVHPRAAAPKPHAIGYTLDDVYGRCSSAKRDAFADVARLCEDFGGRNLRITAANKFAFSCAFEFAHPETGEAMRAIITRDYNHAYYL